MTGTLPDREHPVSRGTLCVKGWSAHEFVASPDRLTQPLLRDGDSFRPIPWDEAIALATGKLRETADRLLELMERARAARDALRAEIAGIDVRRRLVGAPIAAVAAKPVRRFRA